MLLYTSEWPLGMDHNNGFPDEGSPEVSIGNSADRSLKLFFSLFFFEGIISFDILEFEDSSVYICHCNGWIIQ